MGFIFNDPKTNLFVDAIPRLNILDPARVALAGPVTIARQVSALQTAVGAFHQEFYFR